MSNFLSIPAQLANVVQEVYEHEIPGGQLTNLIFQASQLGLGAQWLETKKAYEEANDLLGDIVKVTPTSKVVGDLAQFMVSNKLSEEDVKAKAKELDFPESVLEFLEGFMGQPYGGFPEPLRTDALRGRRKMDKRPGLYLDPIDFPKIKEELKEKYGNVSENDIASYVMCEYFPSRKTVPLKHESFDMSLILTTPIRSQSFRRLP